ncbi:MAG: pilus assembly protein PilP [Bdellovibrionales bacterium]
MMRVPCLLQMVLAFVIGTTAFAQVPDPAEPTPAEVPANPESEMVTAESALGTDPGQYAYDPTGKKDPFKPYRAPRARGDNRPLAPIDPLTQVDISTLQLVAIMWNTTRPRAVVRDTQGRVFTIFKNNRIGRNDGIVVDIREGEVVIVEKFDDGLGNIVREPKVMQMRVAPGAANSTGG